MKKVICLVLLFFSLNVGFSQTEEDYIQNIKVYYAKNIKSKACDEVNKGLEKFPTSVRIAKLKGLVCSSIKNNPPTGGSPTGGTPTGGTSTGGTSSGGTPIGGTSTGGTSTGGSKAGGSTTGGTIIDIIEEPVKKPTNININLNMPSQNIFTWNKSLAEEGVKMTIVITTKSGAEYQRDVTGQESFKFKSGDTRFDGVNCSVKLVIENSENIILRGTQEIKVKTTC
jgi:hypothetical protein